MDGEKDDMDDADADNNALVGCQVTAERRRRQDEEEGGVYHREKKEKQRRRDPRPILYSDDHC